MPSFRCVAFILLVRIWLGLPSAAAAAALQVPANGATCAVAGQVVDLTGAPVPRARVRATAGGLIVADVEAGNDGAFTLELPRGVVNVTATAPDMAPAFARVRVPRADAARGPLQLVLGAALFSSSVTVAAPASEIGGTEGSTSVVTSEVIGLLPARGLDEVLATTPGFSLFRRTPSRTANPTAQGVSLRGLGASGASRALVLADGFPANDPFGGWVYWSRLPLLAIDRVEVARGGRSERYGADAMGGVVGIVTSLPSRGFEGRALAEGGSRGTARLSGYSGVQRGEWNVVASAEVGRSGRVPIVREDDRGPVDTPAGSDHAAGLFGVSWVPSPAFAGTVRVNPFGEQRANGTPLQRNDTRAAQVSAVVGGAAGGGQWEARAWGQWTRFRQTFSIVSPDRASERLANRQRVESDAAGVRARWDQAFGATMVGGGVEAREVEADNVEGPAAGPPGAEGAVGGRQRAAAVFGRASSSVGAGVRVDAGARWESWRNTPSYGPGVSRDASRFSPRLTVTWSAAQGLVAHAAAYGAFRAPTLNELYRGFRVGSMTTLPNENLGPERLGGGEVGLGFTRRRLALRAAGWWSRLDDSIANVTIAPFERQRQNVGAVNGRGLEAEVVTRPAAWLEWVSVLALTRSAFDDSLRPAIDGRRVPQVPGVQWSSRARVAANGGWAALEVRRAGRQYEDDRNQLPLRPALTVDAAAAYRVTRHVEVLLSVENLANAEVEVGRTPVPTIGMPRSFHVGVRFSTR